MLQEGSEEARCPVQGIIDRFRARVGEKELVVEETGVIVVFKELIHRTSGNLAKFDNTCHPLEDLKAVSLSLLELLEVILQGPFPHLHLEKSLRILLLTLAVLSEAMFTFPKLLHRTLCEAAPPQGRGSADDDGDVLR